MTSKTDDKAVHMPSRQDDERHGDNVVPLVPKARTKTAESVHAFRPPAASQGTAQPIGDGDDDPGPTAA